MCMLARLASECCDNGGGAGGAGGGLPVASRHSQTDEVDRWRL